MCDNETVFFDTEALIEGRTAKLTYAGSLTENGASEVYVHYGYGLLWDNLQEIKLDKVDGHYETYITLSCADDLNFCFRDEYNNWDNNGGKNYCATICKEEVTVVKVDPTVISVPKLKKSYFIMKKIKLAFYKAITFLSKSFSGDFKKKAGN